MFEYPSAFCFESRVLFLGLISCETLLSGHSVEFKKNMCRVQSCIFIERHMSEILVYLFSRKDNCFVPVFFVSLVRSQAHGGRQIMQCSVAFRHCAVRIARFELLWDEGNRLALVHEVHTEERVWLAPGKSWYMAADSEIGHLHIVHHEKDDDEEDDEEDGDLPWVIDLFSHTVIQLRSGEIVVTLPTGEEMDYQQRVVPTRVPA